MVSCDPDGGVIAIPENTNKWPTYYRSAAEELLRAKFPDGYVIEHEEETVVNTAQQTQTNTNRTGVPILSALHIVPANEVTTQTTMELRETEWRIRYRKASAPASQPDPSSPLQPGPTQPLRSRSPADEPPN